MFIDSGFFVLGRRVVHDVHAGMLSGFDLTWRGRVATGPLDIHVHPEYPGSTKADIYIFHIKA